MAEIHRGVAEWWQKHIRGGGVGQKETGVAEWGRNAEGWPSGTNNAFAGLLMILRNLCYEEERKNIKRKHSFHSFTQTFIFC